MVAWLNRFCARTIVMGLAAVVVGSAANAAPGAADTRAGHIKALIENQGLKVLAVDFAAAKGSTPPVWAAGTVAAYQDPSWEKVTDQAMTVWNAMFVVLRKDDPKTVLAAPQAWRTYRLFVSTTLVSIAAFDAGVRSAKTDADRKRIFDALYKSISVRVFDTQKQRLIDTAEFTKNHFK